MSAAPTQLERIQNALLDARRARRGRLHRGEARRIAYEIGTSPASVSDIWRMMRRQAVRQWLEWEGRA